jgi:murein DD-endopeptidase MepM/ murein hydrolase activator NlpD
MVRIPGWMACLAVFAMMAASGVDAAEATTATSGFASTSDAFMLLSAHRVAVEVGGDPIVLSAPAATLPLVELIEMVAASLTPPPAPPPPPVPAWLCPVASAVRFADTYGEGRNGGWRHLGVDLTAPMGTPTVAPVAGSVRYSRDSAGGLSWHLDGDDGVYYYGTHLSRFGSVTGRVEAGTVIGYVGQTGNASLPHLHLEVHPGGIGKPAVNPTPLAMKACTNTL